MSERSPVGVICVCKKMVCRGATDVSCRSTTSRRSGPAGGSGRQRPSQRLHREQGQQRLVRTTVAQ
jgi:hypothetical protein